MKTIPTRSLPLFVLTLAIGVAACAGAAAPSASPSQGPAGSGQPSASPGGSGSGSDPGDGGAGGSAPAPVDPGGGQGALVIPRPGQLNVHPVGPTAIEAAIDGRHVTVRVEWVSGVEPCYVLDSVITEVDGNDITIRLFEGSSDPNAICIELAQEKATIVDLGELAPGTWTISAPGGEAVPVTITIS